MQQLYMTCMTVLLKHMGKYSILSNQNLHKEPGKKLLSLASHHQCNAAPDQERLIASWPSPAISSTTLRPCSSPCLNILKRARIAL